MKQYISMELLEALQRVIDHGVPSVDGTHLLSAEFILETINNEYIVTVEDDNLDIETYADVEDN